MKQKRLSSAEMLRLVNEFGLEHPEADESMFDAYIEQKELEHESDAFVVITDGIVRYLEGEDA